MKPNDRYRLFETLSRYDKKYQMFSDYTYVYYKKWILGLVYFFLKIYFTISMFLFRHFLDVSYFFINSILHDIGLDSIAFLYGNPYFNWGKTTAFVALAYPFRFLYLGCIPLGIIYLYCRRLLEGPNSRTWSWYRYDPRESLKDYFFDMLLSVDLSKLSKSEYKYTYETLRPKTKKEEDREFQKKLYEYYGITLKSDVTTGEAELFFDMVTERFATATFLELAFMNRVVEVPLRQKMNKLAITASDWPIKKDGTRRRGFLASGFTGPAFLSEERKRLDGPAFFYTQPPWDWVLAFRFPLHYFVLYPLNYLGAPLTERWAYFRCTYFRRYYWGYHYYWDKQTLSSWIFNCPDPEIAGTISPFREFFIRIPIHFCHTVLAFFLYLYRSSYFSSPFILISWFVKWIWHKVELFWRKFVFFIKGPYYGYARLYDNDLARRFQLSLQSTSIFPLLVGTIFPFSHLKRFFSFWGWENQDYTGDRQRGWRAAWLTFKEFDSFLYINPVVGSSLEQYTSFTIYERMRFAGTVILAYKAHPSFHRYIKLQKVWPRLTDIKKIVKKYRPSRNVLDLSQAQERFQKEPDIFPFFERVEALLRFRLSSRRKSYFKKKLIKKLSPLLNRLHRNVKITKKWLYTGERSFTYWSPVRFSDPANTWFGSFFLSKFLTSMEFLDWGSYRFARYNRILARTEWPVNNEAVLRGEEDMRWNEEGPHNYLGDIFGTWGTWTFWLDWDARKDLEHKIDKGQVVLPPRFLETEEGLVPNEDDPEEDAWDDSLFGRYIDALFLPPLFFCQLVLVPVFLILAPFRFFLSLSNYLNDSFKFFALLPWYFFHRFNRAIKRRFTRISSKLKLKNQYFLKWWDLWFMVRFDKVVSFLKIKNKIFLKDSLLFYKRIRPTAVPVVIDLYIVFIYLPYALLIRPTFQLISFIFDKRNLFFYWGRFYDFRLDGQDLDFENYARLDNADTRFQKDGYNLNVMDPAGPVNQARIPPKRIHLFPSTSLGYKVPSSVLQWEIRNVLEKMSSIADNYALESNVADPNGQPSFDFWAMDTDCIDYEKLFPRTILTEYGDQEERIDPEWEYDIIMEVESQFHHINYWSYSVYPEDVSYRANFYASIRPTRAGYEYWYNSIGWDRLLDTTLFNYVVASSRKAYSHLASTNKRLYREENSYHLHFRSQWWKNFGDRLFRPLIWPKKKYSNRLYAFFGFFFRLLYNYFLVYVAKPFWVFLPTLLHFIFMAFSAVLFLTYFKSFYFVDGWHYPNVYFLPLSPAPLLPLTVMSFLFFIFYSARRILSIHFRKFTEDQSDLVVFFLVHNWFKAHFNEEWMKQYPKHVINRVFGRVFPPL